MGLAPAGRRFCKNLQTSLVLLIRNCSRQRMITYTNLQLYFPRFGFMKIFYIPLQLLPFPEKPTLHRHSYEPTLFMHSALTSQVEHSFMSKNIKKSVREHQVSSIIL